MLQEWQQQVVDAHRLPRQLLGVFERRDGDVLAAEADGLVGVADRCRLEHAVDRVVLQQVGQGLGVGQVINSNDF